MDGFEPFVLFAVVAALLLFVAFNDGGLDIVFRQQFGLGLLWGLGLLVAFGALPRATPSAEVRRVASVLAALIAWTALSLIWAESAEKAYVDLARLLAYAGLVSAVYLGVSRHTWKAAGAAVCAVALLIPLLALLARAVPSALLENSLTGFERLSGSLGYWNALAAWCAMAISIGLGLSAEIRSRGMRALSLGSVPISALALYLTFSRGGVLATAIGVTTVLILTRNRLTGFVHLIVALLASAGLIAFVRGQPEITSAAGFDGGTELIALMLIASAACGAVAWFTRELRLDRPARTKVLGVALSAIGVVAILVGGLAVGSEGVSGAREQFTSGDYPTQEGDPAARLTSLKGARSDIWSSALRAAESAPLLGIGPGAFEFWWTRDVAGGESLREPHSLYLGQLAELGIVGLTLLVALLGLSIAGGWRACRRAGGSTSSALSVALTAAFSAFLFQAGIDWLWESTAVASLALTGIAIVISSGSDRRSRRGSKKGGSPRFAIATFAILAGAAIVPGTVAVERVRASFSALVIGQSAEAVAVADEGVRAAPWMASPYASRALAYVATGDFDSARSNALDAIDREPTNWRHHMLLAGIEARRGSTAASEAALEQARALNGELRVTPEDLLHTVPEGD